MGLTLQLPPDSLHGLTGAVALTMLVLGRYARRIQDGHNDRQGSLPVRDGLDQVPDLTGEGSLGIGFPVRTSLPGLGNELNQGCQVALDDNTSLWTSSRAKSLD